MTSGASAADPGSAGCGPRTCPGPSGIAAGYGWGAAAGATGASGIWLSLGRRERGSARWVPAPLPVPPGSPCARGAGQGEEGREPSRNEDGQSLRPGLPGRGWRRGAVGASSGGKQGFKAGRTPGSCPRPVVLKDGGAGRRGWRTWAWGWRRALGRPPSAENGLSFSCKTRTWSGGDRNGPPGRCRMESRETGPWETPSVKALSLL